MKNILISLTFVVALMIFSDLKSFDASMIFAVLYIAFNTLDILSALKKEQLTDEESLRAMRERDQLLAALKAMQESNPGTLEFTPRSGAQIKQARAAWVQASAVIAEVEKNNGY